MIAQQQQQLQIQLTNLIQQQAAEDQQPATHPPLHVVQPLEKKVPLFMYIVFQSKLTVGCGSTCMLLKISCSVMEGTLAQSVMPGYLLRVT